MSIPDNILAYCAGVIDSDGCITILHNKSKNFCPRVQCGQVATEAVELLHKTFNGNISTSVPPSHSNLRPQIKWQCNNRIAANCASLLLPYLRIKSRQAEIIIEVDKLNKLYGLKRTFPEVNITQELVTVKEAAKLIGKTENTVRQAIQTGRRPSILIDGRRLIPLDCLEEWELSPRHRTRDPETTNRLTQLLNEIRSLNKTGKH